MKGFLPNRLPPIANLILLVVLLFVGFCVAWFFIASVSNLAFGINFQQIGNVMQQPERYPQGWALSMFAQGLVLFLSFAGAALALVKLTGYHVAEYFAPRRPVPSLWLLMAALLVIASLPLMTTLIAWNAQVHLPDALHGVEVWAKEKEDQAQALTKALTNFNSPLRFWIGVLVIAIVPAISEELVFRGVIQRNLVQSFASRHVGVWAAAFIFSAIHLQFFGFVPRFVLGLLLGYLYEWSGNILVPMAAHFTQNFTQLLLLYWQQNQWVSPELDPDANEAMPWPWVLASLLVTAGLLYWLHEHLTNETGPTQLRTLGGKGVAASVPETAVAPAARTLGRDGVDVGRFRD
ncbi:CPBP family intramembrane glutamic endopeptidase [Hymenobacter defluvii]|uniref:CPBP family intramembrane metalloprotease n=1 Tax=Hymenobacter defluvii TaxID=2054411 RepID=A0ABS3TFY6_9BACT|nr:CPBP family intramembrane glutamic endopeptidase [Hymenobacter defluvii]MBO3272556.1 CPBP family intramembrane metalloprotease [Hymenobacter defluvii]